MTVSDGGPASLCERERAQGARGGLVYTLNRLVTSAEQQTLWAMAKWLNSTPKGEGAPAVLRELLIYRHRRPVSLVRPMEACQTAATLSAIVSHWPRFL